MDIKKDENQYIFDTEASWGNADKKFLCLETGTWRTARPVTDSAKCKRCGICFTYCPPQCIRIDEAEENFVPDLMFCKGCGVCAKECPHDSITMISEGEYSK